MSRPQIKMSLNIESLLQSANIPEACSKLTRQLKECLDQHHSEGLRDFYDQLPVLLVRVFGFDNRKGWLGNLDSTSSREWQAVVDLLSPHGPLFRAIFQNTQPAPFYEFPLARLPASARQSISARRYSDLPKVYHLLSSAHLLQESVDSIVLSISEYYAFCFACFLVQSPPSSTSSSSSSLMSSSLPSPLGAHRNPLQTEGSATLRELLRGSCHDAYCSLLLKYLHYFAPTAPSSSDPKPETSLRGDIFLMILAECWFNQNLFVPEAMASSVNSSLFYPAFPTEYNVPSKDIIRAGSILLLHVLSDPALPQTGSSDNRYTLDSRWSFAGSPSFRNASCPGMTVLLKSIQKPFYHFLRLAFSRWPEHWQAAGPVSLIAELWLIAIQPWAAADVMETVVLRPSDFSQSLVNQLLHQPPLQSLHTLSEAVGSLIAVTPAPQGSKTARSNRSTPRLVPRSAAGDGSLLSDVEWPSLASSSLQQKWLPFVAHNLLFYTYGFTDFIQAVARRFDLAREHDADILMHALEVYSPEFLDLLQTLDSILPDLDSRFISRRDSRTQLPNEFAFMIRSHVQELEPRYCPLSSQIDAIQFAAQKLVHSARAQRSSLMFPQTAKQSPGPAGPPPTRPDSQPNRWDSVKKIIQQTAAARTPEVSKRLDRYRSIEGHLRRIFNITEIPLEHDLVAAASTPVSVRAPPERTGVGSLTDTGKRQIARGYRKTCASDIPYLGHAWFQPIASQESAMLVKLLYQISCLVDKYRGNPLQDDNGKPLPPSLNLRPLASYPNLCFALLTTIAVVVVCRIMVSGKA